jgi:hypothetical protein
VAAMCSRIRQRTITSTEISGLTGETGYRSYHTANGNGNSSGDINRPGSKITVYTCPV